jgi:glycosyltransferase involved in cell wall biosynthesis
MGNKNKIIFVANKGYAILNSRKNWLQHFLSKGWCVIVATADDKDCKVLNEMGVICEPILFHRGGLSFIDDFNAYRRLSNIYRKWKPAIIHHFHAKPVILGSLAARNTLKSSVKIINTITGLGHAFIKEGLTGKLAGLGYRISLRKSEVTVFQNKDDRHLFIKQKWITIDKARLIVSAGVDTKYYSFVNRENNESNRPVVLMLGRLLRQKGILEFIDVANRSRHILPNARFILAGEEDLQHPDAISVKSIDIKGPIEYIGRVSDVIPVILKADLFLFPSYREGVPRAVLEAASMGLPTIGFDVPGVREAVIDNHTGFLVPFKDVEALADKVILLLNNKKLRLRMGKTARLLMEDAFDSAIIEKKYFQIYREFISGV